MILHETNGDNSKELYIPPKMLKYKMDFSVCLHGPLVFGHGTKALCATTPTFMSRWQVSQHDFNRCKTALMTSRLSVAFRLSIAYPKLTRFLYSSVPERESSLEGVLPPISHCCGTSE